MVDGYSLVGPHIKIMKKFILLALVFFVSCNVTETTSEEEKVYILIDGQHVEMVSDEYGNQYLKQRIDGFDIYVPFPFETEEEGDTLRSFQAKIIRK